MNLTEFLPHARRYLKKITPAQVQWWRPAQSFRIRPLAQGEYNMNYLVQQEDSPSWVLRVNVGSQINRTDQIVYEYKALQLLQNTGRTPIPLFVDDTRARIQYGVLGMHFLPGEKMHYEAHGMKAAQLFADIHAFTHQFEETHLIQEKHPLSMTYEECASLLPTFFDSPLADQDIVTYLREVLAWSHQERRKEVYFLQDPWNCIINTEVNSSNFICNAEKDHLSLVDWEKPLWGDPSQDLSHFCVPTTTLWKTEYRMDTTTKRSFLQTYRDSLSDQHLKDTIADRVRLRDPFNCLRGISWSAWAWVAYQTGEAAIQNEDTYRKLCFYMDMEFIRSLFDPYLKGESYAG